MADLENEEVIEGPKVSSMIEFGGTAERPNKRHNYWFRAFATDSEPGEGLIFKVARRPGHRRNEDPHPTARIIREDPNGILYAKVKAGEIKVENYHDFVNRKILQARDEEAKKKGKK